MPGNDHSKHYSAADIERYINGQMPPAEMYAMEKDMQNDPFLAEAVEGYKSAAVDSVQEPVQELTARLTKRTAHTTVPLRRNRRWLAAAAAVVMILGSAATWFFLLPGTEQRVAQHQPEEKVAPALMPAIDSAIDDTAAPMPPEAETSDVTEKVHAASPSLKAGEATSRQNATEARPPTIPPSPRVAAPTVSSTRETPAKAAVESSPPPRSAGHTDNLLKKTERRQAVQQHLATYMISGTVADSIGNPLPFANIAVDNMPVDTYTDAHGVFKIITGDSTVVAHIKSIGYQAKTVQLRAGDSPNRVQLQAVDNVNDLAVAGYGQQKKAMTTARTSDSDRLADKEDGPWATPRDGWANYDIYLLNNTRQKNELKGSVELSFMLTPTGSMYDFRVAYATCAGCEREAIRLIKDGPPWQLHNSTAPYRVSLSIRF